MATPPPLRELQRRLRDLIARHGARVPEDPDALAALERAAAELPIRGDEALSAGQRLAIYAGMYFARIRDVLAEDFPATARAAGDRFDGLVERYLAAHPTDDPSLRRAGRHLGRFLARTPEIVRFPWQPELARLEWAMIEAFDARDQAVLAAPALETVAAAEWPDLWIEPVASLRVLDCAYPVDRIRAELLSGSSPAPAAPEATFLRVWRQGTTVYHRRVGSIEARLLAALRDGRRFAELCESLAAETPEEDAARLLVGVLRGWLADEVLAALPSR